MSWQREQEEREYSNPATGKRYGETEREHEARERREWNEHLKEEASNKKAKSGGGGGGSGLTFSDLGLPGERTNLANIILKIGYACLLLGFLLKCIYWASSSTAVSDWGNAILGLSVFCLALIHLFQVIVIGLVISVFALVWFAGRTPEGFKLATVPFSVYAMCIGLIGVVYILKRILSKD